jgi:hypothetical protein
MAKIISPEHLAKMCKARDEWRSKLTPEEQQSFVERGVKTRKINKLKAEIRKLRAKETSQKNAKTLTPNNDDNPVELFSGDPLGLRQHATIYVREEVKTFSDSMETKLRKRDGYGGWLNLPLPYLQKKLKGELDELLTSLEYETREEVMDECVDVANYAMFLWDIMRRGDPRSTAGLVGRKKEQGRT